MLQKFYFYRKLFFLSALLSAICFAGYGVDQTKESVDSAYVFMTEGINSFNLGDFNQADLSFHKAIARIKESEISDSSRLGYSYLNLGAINFMFWRNEDALSYYDSARVILKGIYGNKHSAYVSLLINIGSVYLNTRDLKRAEDFYNQALMILSGNPPTSEILSSIAVVNNNLGLLSEQSGKLDLALGYFDEAIRIRERMNSPEVSSPLRNKADCLRKLGRLKEAEIFYEKSLLTTRKNFGNSYYAYGLANLSYGFFLAHSLQEYDRANEAYQAALEIFRENYGEKHPYISNTHFNIGKLLLAMDNPGAAAESFQRALITLVPDFNESNPQSNPSLEDVPSLIEFLETLKEKGKAFEIISERNQETWPLIISMNTYELATEAIDKIRMGYQSEESKLYLSENQNAIFHDAIRVCYKLYNITSDRQYLEKAFYFAEKNKAANLLASIREIGAREFGRIPAGLIEKETDLKRQIALYTEYIYEEGRLPKPDTEKLNLWQQTLFTLNQDYTELISRLETEFPEYYRLKYNTSISSLAEVQKTLGKEDALIEYSLSDSIIYIFFITKRELRIFEEKLTESFQNDIHSILDIFENRRFAAGVARDFRLFTNSSNSLYKVLISPVEKLLKNYNLIIVPDGILSYLPFELLISTLPPEQDLAYSRLPYLLRNHTISYAHSATLLIEYTSISARRGGRLMAFAPKYESGEVSIPDIFNSRSRYRDNLKPLPASRTEVKNILKLVGGKLWIDDEATERNFKENAPDFNILHLAMHTLIDDLNPMFSKLVFTQDKDSLEDGLLNTFEIYNLSLKASMAVLSSCKSGWGQFQTGEGVLSLARGFLYAGVPSIVMTLWEIEDQSSAEVMTLFYKYLKKGKRKDEALRLAKLEFLDQADMLKSHPYFWGGYVSIGDNSPVFYNKSFVMLMIVGFTILAVAFFVYFRKRARWL
jgi:CHAT domain-containing protein/Tfp pilus assembly protein PilF